MNDTSLIQPPQPRPPGYDGRQSDRALKIQRGVGRYLSQAGFAFVPELVLPNGRRADLMALSGAGRVAIVEIKSSVEDFMSDGKWPDYLAYCDAFYFASLPDVPGDIFPHECGFILADEFGAEMVREDPTLGNPKRQLSAARRKAMMLLFAHSAAKRLAVTTDPFHAERAVT
ncbi:MAG: MmcB family DNA repair protein [Pseudomonadota bacterium]